MLSGFKDVDREILKHVDDKHLIEICSIDRKTWNEVCDDDFLKRRLSRYHDIENYKRIDETWKQFFLRVIYYTSKMKEKFDYTYSDGDFRNQYLLLKRSRAPNIILSNASTHDEVPLIKFALSKGADIHYANDEPLRYAIYYGNFDSVKYLVEHGANIHAKNDEFFKLAKAQALALRTEERQKILQYLKSKF